MSGAPPLWESPWLGHAAIISIVLSAPEARRIPGRREMSRAAVLSRLLDDPRFGLTPEQAEIVLTNACSASNGGLEVTGDLVRLARRSGEDDGQ
jgi:hypothetical protein